MSRLRNLFNFGRKESQTLMAYSFNKVGQPVSTNANYMGFTKEGYQKNAIVFTCISKIAQSGAGIRWTLYKKRAGGKRTEIEDHPLLTLLSRPNPLMAQSSFMEAVIAYRMITGNSYINAVKAKDGTVMELYPVNPHLMKVVPGANGFPQAYVFETSGRKVTFPVDFVKMKSDILHLKTFHPNDPYYGMSPLQAGLLQLDQSNAANTWNLALLQNSATPSGVLQMRVSDSNPSGSMTQDQYERIKAEFYEGHTGQQNSGKPLILEGGLTWQQISMNPKDVEFLKGKEINAHDLARILGVPGEIIGLGNTTFNNYGEAREAFYDETILPLAGNIKDEFNAWLCPMFGPDLELDINKDEIEALVPRRERKFNTYAGANFLTVNEKRAATGYEEIEGGDVFMVGTQILSDLTEKPDDPETDPENPDDETDPEDPKDPKPTDEEPTDEESDAQDENGSKGEGSKKKPETASQAVEAGDVEGEFKAFHLITRNEKSDSWKKQNRRRDRLAVNFERDLKQDLHGLSDVLANAAKGKMDPKLIEFAMVKASSDFMPTIEKTISRHLKNTLHDFGGMILDEAKTTLNIRETKANVRFQGFIDHYVQKRTAQSITHIEGATKKTILRTVKRLVDENLSEGDSNHDLADGIRDHFDSLTAGRARTIARTEVALASNNASLEAVKSLQVPGIQKEWVTAGDDRVRDGDHDGADHSVMNGAEMPLDEKFGVPPDTLMDGPGDDSAPADQVINCRCVLVYKQKGND